MTQTIIAATVTWDGGGATNLWSYNDGGGGGGKFTNWGPNGKLPKTGDEFEFGGTSRLTSTNDLTGISTASVKFLSGAGAFVLGGNALTLTGGSVTNNSTSLQTINMALGLNATITFATTTGDMTVGGQVSGTGGINKTGVNSLLLTGANIFSGTTTITAGSLLANNSSGSATGTGAVSVSGIFGGTGTIAPTGSNGITVNSGGVIAPGSGNTPGTLTFNFTSTSGGLTMNSGAGFQFHLGSLGMGDMLSIVGASAGDVAFNNNMINFMGTGELGSYKIFDTSSNNANTWTGLTVNGSGQITSGLNYTNLNSGYTAIFYMGGGSYGGTSGDIYVQVIPEPRAALLGGLGVLMLLLRRRRS
ncbi:MAG: hypothetical protein V4727_06520 [Verrucomicrobiota bacterium]